MAELLNNRPIWAAVAAWAIAQLLKIILTLIWDGRFDLSRFYGSGGMPSSHTALVVAMTVCLGRVYGFDKPSFAVSTILSFVVMYDAAGVRRAAGKQAEVLNLLIFQSGLKIEEQLKELLGHTPVQVFAGAVLGIIVGAVF